tara:strand:- start:213 stop:434 length:222 start_codon:yes stop_codon:yes gene_type:complete
MKDFSVWPGVLIVCFVAITILTIFPSKHKQCIDRNSAIMEKLKENETDREIIKNKGYEIGIGCRADTDFNLTE